MSYSYSNGAIEKTFHQLKKGFLFLRRCNECETRSMIPKFVFVLKAIPDLLHPLIFLYIVDNYSICLLLQRIVWFNSIFRSLWKYCLMTSIGK